MARVAVSLPARRAQQPATLIHPPGRWPGLGLRELWSARSIALVLARRSLKVRYRQTLVGAGWVIFQPLLLMLVFTAFFGIMVRLPSNGAPYPVFVFIGLLAWNELVKIVNEGSSSVVANRGLVLKVYFPRAHLPISVALATIIDMVFGVLVLGVLMAIFGIVPGAQIVTVPLFFAVGIAAALGATFWLSALYVSYRDVAQLLPFLVQVWFFVTPIIYPSSIVPESIRTLYFLNPMAVVVEGLRWAFTGVSGPSPEQIALGCLSALGLLVSGYLFFRYREPFFPDVA